MDATMRTVLLCVTVVLQLGLSLGPLFTEEYRSRPLATGAFAALACVPAVCSWWVLRQRPLPAAVTAGGTAVVLAAAFCATAAVDPGRRFQAPDWSFGLVQWHLLLLLLDRIRLLVAVLAAHLTASMGTFLVAGPPDRAAIGAACTVAFGAVSVQAAVIVISRLLRRRSREALAVADEHDRLELRVLTARQWEQHQRTLFAGQLGTTLPLLAGLADGALDPRDEDTRRRCALAATQLRRLFAENDETPDPLVHEMTACVDVAERRGVNVSFAVSGAPVTVPAQVRRRLTGPVATALSAARGRARVSVLRTGEAVRIAVVTDTDTDTDSGPRPEAVTTADGRVEVVSDHYGDFLRLEALWRR
ncbi:hypothetical protein DVA86_27150 [Streptomyces armeniacus]|uniref:Uncharacterized protein n=2 Tax=Streptomyces armeniacus TaxID=83291 RepID=A0A345Y1C2_9ACTN|nr:hypothetical protein DVA86_27150 [Streptomyces armeniacus]